MENFLNDILNAIRFENDFTEKWYGSICEYTSKKTYSANKRYYNILIVTDYEKVLTTAYLIDTMSKQKVSMIAEVETDFPEKIVKDFNLFNIEDQFLNTLLKL